tara:strand:- start:231 stop:353 length:123 start_codon:yes stop_codon:yes gene_type:complete
MGRRVDNVLILVRVDIIYYRLSEIATLFGDPTNAHEKFSW